MENKRKEVKGMRYEKGWNRIGEGISVKETGKVTGRHGERRKNRTKNRAENGEFTRNFEVRYQSCRTV